MEGPESTPIRAGAVVGWAAWAGLHVAEIETEAASSALIHALAARARGASRGEVRTRHPPVEV